MGWLCSIHSWWWKAKGIWMGSGPDIYCFPTKYSRFANPQNWIVQTMWNIICRFDGLRFWSSAFCLGTLRLQYGWATGSFCPIFTGPPVQHGPALSPGTVQTRVQWFKVGSWADFGWKNAAGASGDGQNYINAKWVHEYPNIFQHLSFRYMLFKSLYHKPFFIYVYYILYTAHTCYIIIYIYIFIPFIHSSILQWLWSLISIEFYWCIHGWFNDVQCISDVRPDHHGPPVPPGPYRARRWAPGNLCRGMASEACRDGQAGAWSHGETWHTHHSNVKDWGPNWSLSWTYGVESQDTVFITIVKNKHISWLYM